MFVLTKFDNTICPGTNHSLVGSRGCGKSTTARLIERFYHTNEGQVLIDGVDIRELNVRWLRSQMEYVGQMPTLLMLSIRQNIALAAAMKVIIDGSPGKKTLTRRTVTDVEIEAAAREGYAHDFIMKLPEQYDTLIGERGALLSRGQKQRISITRALVRNPKLHLLDESTGALDAQSERIVQDALENAAADRATVTTACRLSTVKNANVLSLIERGNVRSEEQAAVHDEDSVGEAFKAETTHITSVSKTKHSAEEEDDEKKADVDPGVFKRGSRMNINEIPFLLMAMIGVAVAGATFSAIAVSFPRAIFHAWDEWRATTRKLRGLAFRAILRQEMGFFDVREQLVGRLTTRLATEAILALGITGSILDGAALITSTLITGFLITFLSCWRIALVVTIVLPLRALYEATQVKIMQGFESDSQMKFAEAGAVASEAVDNYDTLSATGVQNILIERYNKELEGPLQNGRKGAFIGGVAFEFCGICIASIVGDFVLGISGLLFAGSAVGQACLFLSDFGKSKVAATNMFRLLDRKSVIDPKSEENGDRKALNVAGRVCTKVKFEYLTRPDVPVLRGVVSESGLVQLSHEDRTPETESMTIEAAKAA